MNRSDLIRALLCRQKGLTRLEITHVVDTVFDALTQSLESGARVELRGFGTFSVREREEHMGRNPRSGTKVYIPPKKVPFFRAGKALLVRLNGEEKV